MEQKKTSGRNFAIVTVVILLLLIGFEEYKIGFGRFIFHIAAIGVKERLNRVPFNSVDWKNPTLNQGKNPIRIRMIDDLLKRHQLEGMTKKQVLNLLGQPDFKNQYSSSDFVYELGPERSWLSVDGEVLVITFDTNGIVVKVEVNTT